MAETEFEQAFLKVVGVSTSVVALAAGDSAIQTDLWIRTLEKLKSAQTASVRMVAERYAFQVGRQRRRYAEQTLLAPLGMNMEDFVNRQASMSPEVVSDIYRGIHDYSPEVETIVTGIDPGGEAQIYVVDHFGRLSCFTDIGFGAVGTGATHANSTLMFAQYAPWFPFPRALWVAYMAKKQSEVAPGVGSATDVLTIGFRNRSWTRLPQSFVDGIEEIRKAFQEDAGKALDSAQVKIRDHVEQAIAAETPRQIELPAPGTVAAVAVSPIHTKNEPNSD